MDKFWAIFLSGPKVTHPVNQFEAPYKRYQTEEEAITVAQGETQTDGQPRTIAVFYATVKRGPIPVEVDRAPL